ncbi:MAG: VacB/RNase II family 3'-5' exoribonuclease [Ignavibacteriales bacterium]|nr:VacB/RNase II family 3'-5' exoribonuclease [Ignavibacteriales bacterium]
MKKMILNYFKQHPNVVLKSKELQKRLKLSVEHEYNNLKTVLNSLLKKGSLLREGKRFRLNPALVDKLIGKLYFIHDNDFGYVHLKNNNLGKIFISINNMSDANDGDTVEVTLLNKKRGKHREGKIVSIIKKQYLKSDLKYKNKPYLNNQANSLSRNKPKLLDDIIEDKEIKKLNKKDEDYEVAMIAKRCELDYKFHKAVISESENLMTEISEDEIAKRLDLRKKNIFTIDPQTAKDFDDAVSIEEIDNGNYLIGIHIADVSHYVRRNSSVYNEALNRGTSVYLVGKVIPMLPEKLSNNICSLKPLEDRLTFSVLVELTHDCKIVKHQIKKTIINSKKRFTYEDVQNILDKGKGKFVNELTKLNEIAKVLRAQRTRTGSINFISNDVEFKLDNDGNILDARVKEILDSHKLIEELMLLANKIIASAIKPNSRKQNYDFIYRVHDRPDIDKATEFAKFVNTLGYKFDPYAKNLAKEFQKVIQLAEKTEEKALVNDIAIRSMAKAVYSNINIGHYGLGFKNYTHFTSPIRRFPDLVVHMLINNYINNGYKPIFKQKEIIDICERSSIQERKAINAERLSIKLKQIEYMKNKIGEIFEGVVSGIIYFGVFIELKLNLAEGLIRLSDIKDDYYEYDSNNFSIVGVRKGRRIRLGDKVKVRLKSVNLKREEINFELSEN